MLIRVYSLQYGKYLCSGNKVVQKIVSNFFLAKGFFVNMDVYFQNMAIRSCNYASQGVVKSQKVIVTKKFLCVTYLLHMCEYKNINPSKIKP